MKCLLEQLSNVELEAVAMLVGVDTVGSSFRNYMREVPALDDGFTMGDAARAYLSCRLIAMVRIGQRRNEL